MLSWIPSVAFSQSIYPKQINDSLVAITVKQLKETNLIFLEHDKLLKENETLKRSSDKMSEMIGNYRQIVDLQDTKIGQQANELLVKDKQISKISEDLLKSKKKVKRRNFAILGTSIFAGLASAICICR